MYWNKWAWIFSNKFYTQGNDQVRFEMTYYALYPQVKVGCCWQTLMIVLEIEGPGGKRA